MKNSDALVEYIRTLVRDDVAANDEIEAQLDREGWGDDFPRFSTVLFFLAVNLRFGNELDRARIIQFVAELRISTSNGGPEIDASAAESLIAAAIDQTLDYNISQEMIGRIQGATIYKALKEANLTDQDLTSLIQEATEITDNASKNDTK
jgi:phage FluMu protein gp41